MTETQFWELIGKVFRLPDDKIQSIGYDRIQVFVITKYLKENGADSIIKFQEILNEKIRDLFLPKIGELFLFTSYDLSNKENTKFKYISVDGFIDFRAWIVGLGKKSYETFLNFESEEELFQFDLDVNRAFREDLVFLTSKIADEELGIEIDLEHYFDKDADELYSKMNWENLDMKYPQLFKTYQGKLKNGY